MAMSDTAGSSFAQWAALYNHHHDASPTGAFLPDDDALAADVGTGVGIGTGATAAAVASPTSGASSGGSGSPTKAAAQHQQKQLHGVEGPRIGKPAGAARRRSRASRRAPVTLLNTDTANFRAMVQQFTGIPAPPAGSFGAPVINFAADYGFPPASSGFMSFDHHQQQLHRSQHAAAPLQEQLRRQQQQYTGGASSSPFGYTNGNGLLHGGNDIFGSHGGFAASAEDRMLLQSIQAAQMPHMPPVSAAANATSTNGFFA